MTSGKTREEFQVFIAERKREADQLHQGLSTVLASFGVFRCSKQCLDARSDIYVASAIISPSLYPGNEWQLTYLSDDLATGHIGCNGIEELARLIRSLLCDGYAPDEEFRQMLKWKRAK